MVVKKFLAFRFERVHVESMPSERLTPARIAELRELEAAWMRRPSEENRMRFLMAIMVNTHELLESAEALAQRPVVEVLPQDQRRTDLAEMIEKLIRMGHAGAVPYLYAAWDAGFTAEQRKGKR